jgi:hypothetical protein
VYMRGKASERVTTVEAPPICQKGGSDGSSTTIRLSYLLLI